jgi:hypothetical protein
MSQDELAQKVSYSPSLVAMVETSRRIPSEDFTVRCDDALDTGGLLRRLLDLVGRESMPGWFRPWLEIEQEAVALRSYHPSLVDGLLQTPEYIRAVLHADASLTDEEVSQSVVSRLERQSIITGEDPPMFIAVIDECVLRRPVGGPEVMAGQCLHLVELSNRPRMLLQVIPISTGMHSGLDGAFVIATFEGAGEVVYLDGQRGQVIERTEDVEVVKRSWESLRSEALPRKQSVDLIMEVAETWKRWKV